MGDSEEEHERSRGRDKFRRERNDYGSGDKGRSSRSDSHRDRRGSWRDDRRRGRDEYEDDRRRYSAGSYGRGPRDWSPPPSKRMRKAEWESLRDYPGPGVMTPYGMRPPMWHMPLPGSHPPGPPLVTGIPRELNVTPQGPTRQSLLSFKHFLAQEDDNIDETDAITRYNDYKNDFKRNQMEEFFEKHKDEDWFISQYHPVSLEAARKITASQLLSRVNAFVYLLENGWLDRVPLSQDHSEEVIRIMDAAVIKMEGGTDHNLSVLDIKKDGDKEVEKKSLVEETRLKETKQKTKTSTSDPDVSFEDDLDAGKQPLTKTNGSDTLEEAPMHDASPPPVDSTQNGSEGLNMKIQTSSPEPCLPQSLHKTCSVYIRHIPAKVSSSDIVTICKTIPGYLRIAFAEASSEKNYERRGWITYSSETDISTVLAKLTSVKIEDCQLTCSINRDLTRRVKYSAAASWAKKAVQSDISHAMKLIGFMDAKHLLWQYSSVGKENLNPVLAGKDVLLIQEESVAMEASEDEEGAINDSSLDIVPENSEKMKAFEQLLWYLRLVHSCDFYAATFFSSEDSMPHRCGIFTVRPKCPDAFSGQSDVVAYCKEMESKIKPLLVKKKELTDLEMDKYGKKDPVSEAERFVEKNTQKLSESKYLCPLSGKKFKGPEFVKKHIFNKHMDKVDAVRKTAELFNNYLRDPGRPMPLDTSVRTPVLPPNPKTPSSEEAPSLTPIMAPGGGGGVSTPSGPLVGIGPRGVPWGQDHMMRMFNRGGGGSGGYGNYRGGMGDRVMRSRGGRRGRGRRNVADYRDLDTPDEVY